MKKLCIIMMFLLVVVGVAACAQDVSAPVTDSGVKNVPSSVTEDPSSAVELPTRGNDTSAQEPASSISEPEENLPVTSDVSSQQSPAQIIKADSSSVVLRMPTEVKFGEVATTTIVNNSSYQISFGADYTFQYYINNEWIDLQNEEGKERMWLEWACLVEPQGDAPLDFVIYQDEFTTALQPGEYRLLKNIYPRVEGMDSHFEITGNFTIK